MKITLIAEHAGTRRSGADAYPADPAARVHSLAAALKGSDHDVTVCVSDAMRGPHSADARAFADQLAQRWRQDPPDVAHAHGLFAGMAALCGARDLDIPVVQAFSSLASSDRCGQAGHGRVLTGRGRLEEAVGRGADAVLAATSDDRSALVRRGLARTAIKVVPDGVDVARFLPSGEVAQRNGRPRLLMIAPLSERQVVATALRAVAQVPEAELVLAGGSPRAQLSRARGYQEITALASRLRLDDRLCLAGHLSQDLAPALLRSADIVLALAPAEPFAMVALEAMACGIPVVATPAGAQRDAVIHGTTGFLVPPGEPDVLARRIRQLLATPMLAEACGLAGTTRIRTRYSWERIARETLDVYSSLRRPASEPAAADPAAADPAAA